MIFNKKKFRAHPIFSFHPPVSSSRSYKCKMVRGSGICLFQLFHMARHGDGQEAGLTKALLMQCCVGTISLTNYAGKEI